jgi:hypothetical protein
LKWLSEHATRAFLPTSSVGSYSDIPPNFGLWFNVFSQHGFTALLRRNGSVIWESPPPSTAF